jgi:hypothetical protein
MKKIALLMGCLLIARFATAQIGLGINTPHPNAYFEINSTNKGVLLPRMTAAQRLAIAPNTTANGLLVFDTDSSAYMFWTGALWKKMGGEDGRNWSLNGNSNTNPPSSSNNTVINFATDNFLGTPDARDVSFVAGGNELLRLKQFSTGGRVGLSNRNPEYSLDIRATEINIETQLQGMRLIPKTLFDIFNSSNVDKGLVLGYNPSNVNETALWNHANNTNGAIRFGLDVFNNSVSPAFSITGTGQGINQRSPLYFLDIHTQSQFAAANSNALNKNGIRISYPNQGADANMQRGLLLGLATNGDYKSYIWNYDDGSGIYSPSKAILFGIGADNNRPTLQMQDGILGIGHAKNGAVYPSVLNIQTNYAHTLSKKGLSIINDNATNDELAYVGLDASDNLEVSKFATGDIRFNTGNQNRAIITAAGNVGVGTTAPLTRLHVADSSVLFTSSSLSNAVPPPIQGPGTRTMWYATRAAFRTGRALGNEWDKDSIGSASFACGLSNTAIADISFATGDYNRASGGSSFVAGSFNHSVGSSSFATGFTTTALGFASSTFGGNTVASGNYAFATGGNTFAKAAGSFSAGSYNDDADNPDPANPNDADRIFQIGNGIGAVRSNAITVLRNGNIGIGTTTPNAPLQFDNNIANRKLVLYDANNNDHQYYGLGINGGTLRYQVDATGADHVFFAGVNNSSSSELMRIKGNGNVGIGNNPDFLLDVNNRMRIRSGGNLSNSAGIWLNNSSNSSLQSFIGNETDNTVGFYGNSSGWNFTMNTTTGKIKIADGTQGAGRVLTSDANGEASWVNTNANKAAVNATFPGFGANISAAVTNTYTNLFIDLPPGKWLVIGTYLLSQGGVALTSGQSIFVRTFFSASNLSVVNTGDAIGSGLMSGHLAYPTPFSVMNGQNIINNTSGGTKRYYVWAAIEKTGSPDPGFFLNNLCGNFWNENNLVAIPMN